MSCSIERSIPSRAKRELFQASVHGRGLAVICFFLAASTLWPTAARGVCNNGCFSGENTVLGESASTGSSFTTAIGYRALANNTTSGNTAVGAEALEANTSGSLNTAMGVFALSSNTTASDNTAIGYGALQHDITGANNTATGECADRSESAASACSERLGPSGHGWRDLRRAEARPSEVIDTAA
jgi:hypothetical protein